MTGKQGEPINATLNLLPADAGGLREPLPSGTRSILLAFDGAESPMAGAAIDVPNGGSLRSGERQLNVQLRFWTSESRDTVLKNRSFKLWYGRIVGDGEITTNT